MEKAEELIQRLIGCPTDPHIGGIANDLLREFFGGYPLEALRELLQQHEDLVLRVAIWITSELGYRAKPLLEESLRLLGHPNPFIRFHAIDSIHACADGSEGEGRIAASVISLLNDPDATVRRRAFEFLLMSTDARLEAALRWLEQAGARDDLQVHLRRGLSHDASDAHGLIEAFYSPDPVARRFAVVAAKRLAVVDPAPLAHAVASENPDVRDDGAVALRTMRLEAQLQKRRQFEKRRRDQLDSGAGR